MNPSGRDRARHQARIAPTALLAVRNDRLAEVLSMVMCVCTSVESGWSGVNWKEGQVEVQVQALHFFSPSEVSHSAAMT